MKVLMFAMGLFIIAVLSNLVLAIFVLGNNPRARLNRVFGVLALVVAAWSVVTYFEDTAIGAPFIDSLVILDFILASSMVQLFFWFCYTLTSHKNQALLIINSIGLVMCIGLVLAGQIVEIQLIEEKVSFMPLAGYSVFLGYLAYGILGGLILLANRYRKVRGREHTQIAYIFYGLFLCALTIVVTNVVLPNYFEVPPAVTRIGIYSTLFLTGAMAYVIIRHRFLSIRLLVARSVAYVLLIAALAGIYATGLFWVSWVLFPGSETTAAQNWVYIVLAVLLAITFQPLREFFERMTDKVLFRDHYDSQSVLSSFGRVLVGEVQLEALAHKSLQHICDELKISHGHLYVLDGGEIYHVSHYGSVPRRLPALPRLKALRHRLAVTDELEMGKERSVLEDFGMRVSLHLRTKSELVGYVLLGDKQSGDIYVEQDIKLIEIMGQELAVAISNAKAYDRIAHFNETLQQKVDDATARLREANLHLKDLDKAKDEFISIASHQLRTPLTSIKGYLSMILDGDAGKITKQQREFIEYAFGGSQRMMHLISDLLNVSRMSAGKFRLEKTEVDVVNMVAEEVEQLKQAAAAKGLVLKFKPPAKKLPKIMIDENKTRQVVMNFIDNALYYTKEGSVTAEVTRTANNLELTVVDTGIGVPEAARNSMFTKFYRASNAQQVRPDGTGLGLYLAKKVIEDQGGTIIFESTEGRGSTFGFSLPLNTK